MTKRQGLLLALVLACGSTLLTYLWYSGKAPTAEAAKPAAPATQQAAAVAPAPGERTTAAGYVVPRHDRAVVITVDATRGAGALAQPSDRVDILVAATDTQQRHLAETIAQDVPVLGQAGAQAATAPATTTDGKRQIVVSVSPQDAQRLMAAQVRGALVVTLRNPTDREYAFVRPVANPDAPKPAVTIKPAPAVTAAKPPAPAPAAAPAPKPARTRVRPGPRHSSMVVAGLPPEPVRALPAPPPPAPAVRHLAPPVTPAPAPGKAIEVVKGTSVQTVMVKE